MALPVLGGEGGEGGDAGGGDGGGEDEGGGCGICCDGDGAGGEEEIETVGAINCVKPGIWVVRRWKPRPGAAFGETVAVDPMPGTALATGAFADKGVAVTDDVEPVDAALGAGVVVNMDAPSAASPVAAIEMRLSVPVLAVRSGATGCAEAAVACDVTVPLEGAATGDIAGRFVSFRWGVRAAAGVLAEGGGAVDAPLSAGAASEAWR